MHGAEEVGHHLEFGCTTQFAGVQHGSAQRGEHREHGLEGRARATGEDCDIPRGGAVATTRDRAIECHATLGRDQRA